MDWTQIIVALASVIAAAITWASRRVAASSAESAALSKRQRMGLKLADIGLRMADRAWSRLSAWGQVAFADGTISDAERQQVEDIVRGLIHEFASEEELKEIAAAFELPLPGIIAKVASFIIERYAFAHDPTNPTVSAKTYPLSEQAQAIIEEPPVPPAPVGADGSGG